MPPTDIRQRAISLIEQLPQNRLEAVVQLLEVLTESQTQSIENTEETHLLEIIQRRLPEAEQNRLSELRDRCEWGTLSEAEHQELLRYEDFLEQHRVQRLEAMMQLAKLRDIDLSALNLQFSPLHSSNVA